MVVEKLNLNEFEKSLGITNIQRDGSPQQGFVIQFFFEKFHFNLPTDPKTKPTFSSLNNQLKIYSQLEGKELQDLNGNLQQVFLNRKEWMIGTDVKQKLEGYYTTNSTQEETTTDDNDLSTYISVTVPQAIRMHSGKVQFDGVIGHIENDTADFIKEASWKCLNCEQSQTKQIFNILDIPNNPKKCFHCESSMGFEHNHKYISSRLLKIQSEDNSTDVSLEMLPVYVFNEHTDNIQISGRVKVYGKIVKRQNPFNKQFHSVILAKFIEYKDRKKMELTAKDRVEMSRFSKRKTLETDLINQFAKNVIGEEFAKLTCIISAIGAPEIIDPTTSRLIRRGRMHILKIGPPGGGKTELLKSSQDLRPNSKMVEGTNTTGGSLTSMIVQDEGKLHLRLGVAATTVKSILIINEFDKLPDEHKNAILEVMERGESILNKYAFLKSINTQTTVFASANPVNGNWINSSFIEAKELPFPLQILSRFDSILIFRRPQTKEAHKEFANAYLNLTSEDLTSDHSFLAKYIEWVKEIDYVTINQDAKNLLIKYYANLASNQNIELDISNRTFVSICRYAEAFARLYHKNEVTEKIAERTIEHYDEMLHRVNLTFQHKLDPSIYAFDKIVEYLQRKTGNASDSIVLVDAIKNIALKDETVADYIGTEFNRKRNNKLDRLCEKILKIDSNKLGITGIRPATIYWKHEKGCKCGYCSNFDAQRGESDQCGTEKPTPLLKKIKIFIKNFLIR